MKQLPDPGQRKPARTPPIASVETIMNRAKRASEKHHFHSYAFEPSQENYEKVIGLIDTAIKKKWTVEQTKEQCKQLKMEMNEAAFVLNFAHVYWPGFEQEKDLRESPEDMVKYLLKEKTSTFKESGYCSYFVSLLTEDGVPAGFATGAIGSLARIFEKFGLEKPEKDLTVTFVGYVALSPAGQGKGADTVLLTDVEKLVQTLGRKTDYFVAQVDRPEDYAAELERIKARMDKLGGRPLKTAKIKKLTETKEEWEERIKTGKVLLALWERRYGLGHVEGLRSMEIIHDYENLEKPLMSPEKQPQLELLLRSGSEKKEIPLDELLAITKALYLYYGVLPGTKIEHSGENALERYMTYTFEKVVRARVMYRNG